MKVNNRRHAKMSRKASAILALCVVLVLTIAVGYLGVHGTWLDSRGLYKLLPWRPPPTWTTGLRASHLALT